MLHVEPWCQGVAPPDGVGTIESPYQGELTLRPGASNSDSPPAATVRPDAEGRFELDLPPGRYCVLTADRLESLERALQQAQARPNPFGLDLACVERQWHQCRAVIDVGGEDTEVATIRIMDRCGWNLPCALRPPDPPPSAAPGR